MARSRLPITDPIAAEFIAWCEREKIPENTIKRRRALLRSIGNPGTATREEIESWWVSRRHLQDSTRANDLAVLRSFFKWAQIWEHRTDDPSVRIRSPKPGKGAPKPVNAREWDQILAHLADDPPMRRAVHLGAGAGLRVAEAASLRWSDIDEDRRVARVTGKGRKTRIVALSQRLLDELGPNAGGNVVTGKAKGWAPDTLGAKVNQAIKAAGVDATFHKLRHRYGTLAYQRTKDPKAVAEQMGHASVATTMSFYAAAADDAARSIADAVTEDW